MSYALSRPSPVRRSGLLGIVIGVHIAVVLLLLAIKTVAPQIREMPLIVDLLPAPALEEKQPEAKPLPVAKPQPVIRAKPIPAPKLPVAVLETSRTEVAAPATPVTPSETKPAQPVAAPATLAIEAVSQARFDADYLRNPAPAYPVLARRMGEEGKVLLRVLVNPQGGADTVEIKTSSGSTRLDESARKTVLNWKFIPAKRGDTTLQSWVLVPVIFKLEQ